MYLSKIKLSSLKKGIKTKKSKEEFTHSLVESLFPYEIESRIRTRKLWNLEKNNLLILSESKPDEETLKNMGIKEGDFLSKRYTPLLKSIKKNNKYFFRITINPTKKHNGKVIPIYNDQEVMEYLERRSEIRGFSLDNFYIKEKSTITIKNNINLPKITFEGFLKVTDVEKFQETLKKGIGRGKAYGFGLMLVA